MQRAKRLGGGGMTGAKLAISFAIALGLSACAEAQRYSPFNLPPVNPSSPVAGYAEQVSQETFATPPFTAVPPKVVDIRPPAAYKTAVVNKVQQRRDVAAWLAAHPQLTTDTDAFETKQQARIPAREHVPVGVQRDAESESFAKRLREQAQQPAPKQ